MIILNNINTIFVRIPKTASTSLSAFLIKNCATKSDTYTWVRDAGIDANNIKNKDKASAEVTYRLMHASLTDGVRYNLLNTQKIETNHIISVIRNPYERALSGFFFSLRGTSYTPTIELFRKQFTDDYQPIRYSTLFYPPQHTYTIYNGKQYSNFWVFDRLTKHIEQFIETHNISVKYPLYKYKDSKIINYSETINTYFDSHSKKILEKHFKDDFELYESLL